MTEIGWRRLHPLTILKELGTLAWAIVGAFVLDFESFEMPDEAIVPEAIAAGVVFVIAVARYRFTSYRLTDHAVELRRGVIIKSFQSMPRSRVQSVNNTTGIIGRFLGVTTVEISAADGEDIQVGFVSEADAGLLRRALRRGEEGSESVDEDRFQRQGPWLGRLEARRLAVFGLTEPSFVTVALVALAVSAPSIYFGGYFVPLTLIPMFAWPVMRTFAMFDLHSWIDGDRVRIEAGLLSRHRTEAPTARIQSVRVERPLLRRLIGYETVAMVTADVSLNRENVVAGGTVAPLEPIGGWRAIARQLIDEVDLGEPSLRRPSRLAIRRIIVRGLVVGSIPIAGLGLAAHVLAFPLWPPATLAVAYLTGLVWYARRRWRLLGWAFDGEHLLVRYGVISIKLAAVPTRKVQNVEVSSSWFQRRLGLASVHFDTAGTGAAGSIGAVDLEEKDARFMAERVAETAARIALPDGV